MYLILCQEVMEKDIQNGMKLLNVNVDQIQAFVIINNVGMNSSAWECECDKLPNIGQY